MKALSAFMRFNTTRRGDMTERARAHIYRTKTVATPPQSLRESHTVTKRTIAGFPSYRVTSRTVRSESTVLYLYGGGYVSPISPQHWTLIGQLADAGIRVEVPIYGLAPRYDHRDAHRFLTTVYRRLLVEMAGTPLSIVGDSAGGGLALLMAQTAVTLGLPQPDRLVLISPWLDLSLSNPAITPIERRDPWLSRTTLDMAAKAWAPDRSLTHSSVSPMYGPLGGLAPTDVHIGTHDLLYPDALRFHERATAAGTDVQLHTCPSAIHVYPMTPTPEGRAATRTIIESLQAA